MSSAERWRVELPSSISRILSLGRVTLRPAFRRSLPCITLALQKVALRGIRYDPRYAIGFPIYYPERFRDADPVRLRLPDEHSAGQLHRGPGARSAAGGDDPQPGPLSSRHANGSRSF